MKLKVLDFARAEFDLQDNELEILIEDTLEKVLGIYDLALRWKNRGKTTEDEWEKFHHIDENVFWATWTLLVVEAVITPRKTASLI